MLVSNLGSKSLGVIANRTAAVRQTRAGYWELGAVDGTADPRLVMLSIITAGMLGLESGQELKIKDCQKFMFRTILDDQEAKKHGVTETTPTSLKEPLAALRK